MLRAAGLNTTMGYLQFKYITKLVALFIILSPQGKKVGAARCEYVFYFHTSKASERLKVVLLHLRRINVKTTGGLINIPVEDFHMV
jgi:hypothetical protein